MDKEIILSNNKRDFNYGIALLRSLMCFEVVLNHYWPEKFSGQVKALVPLGLFTTFAVCFFIFLSFFLMGDFFFNINSLGIKKRFWRLIYPQIGWTLIYWIAYSIIQIKIDFGITFSDLFWQLFTGASYKLNPPLWYQVLLIILTAMYLLIFRLFKEKKGLFITWVLVFISLVLEYSGINYRLFDSMRYELKWSFGRFVEMIPYATLGLSCAYFKIFEKMKQNRIHASILLFLFSCFFLKYLIIKPGEGFGYEFDSRIICVLLISGFVYILPFEYLPLKCKRIIKFITKYTLGIYCMHIGLGQIINYVLKRNEIIMSNFIICIIIYVVGFLTSFCLSKIPTKYTKDLVN